MGLTSSPRRRRRLAWLLALAAVAAVVAAVVVVLPRHGGSGARTFTPATPQNAFGTTTTTPNPAKEQAAANASAKAVRPLATAFMTDVVHRRHLAQAHALLAPGLAAKYALSDWRAGKHLPVSLDQQTPHSVSTVLSFSGAKTAGFVSAVNGESPTPLVAVRFDREGGRWVVDYISQGHSSRLVDQSNFAPGGFLPGSYNQSKRDWLILLLGFCAVVAVVVLLDRLLGGGKTARA